MRPFRLVCAPLALDSQAIFSDPFTAMTYRPLIAALCTWVLTHGAVHAQVLRCEDAQGHITYTNTGCPHSKAIKEVVPVQSAHEKAQQDAQYQQAVQRKRAEQQAWDERNAAQQQADAARAAVQAVQRPAPAPVVVQVPTNAAPSYGPFYPPRPPHVRPQPPLPPGPNPQAPGYNCNVFKCYDGKGNTWNRP